MNAAIETPSTRYAPQPDGATEAERVPLELLRTLVRPETADRCRWARFIDGGAKVEIAMPVPCRLVLPADPATLLEAVRPAYRVLARAAG